MKKYPHEAKLNAVLEGSFHGNKVRILYVTALENGYNRKLGQTWVDTYKKGIVTKLIGMD